MKKLIILIAVVSGLLLSSCKKENVSIDNTQYYTKCTEYLASPIQVECISYTFIGNDKYELTLLTFTNGIVSGTKKVQYSTTSISTFVIKQHCYKSLIP